MNTAGTQPYKYRYPFSPRFPPIQAAESGNLTANHQDLVDGIVSSRKQRSLKGRPLADGEGGASGEQELLKPLASPCKEEGCWPGTVFWGLGTSCRSADCVELSSQGFSSPYTWPFQVHHHYTKPDSSFSIHIQLLRHPDHSLSFSPLHLCIQATSSAWASLPSQSNNCKPSPSSGSTAKTASSKKSSLIPHLSGSCTVCSLLSSGVSWSFLSDTWPSF